MKLILVILPFIANFCFGQKWQADVMLGISGYSGDLTEKYFMSQSLGPGINANLRYSAFGDRFVFRLGAGFARFGADDKNSKESDFLVRNLNFKTNLFEGSLCVEWNIVDPNQYEGYPYIFAGAGLFHFNPYTYDNDQVKTYLQPLGTEGQGLTQFPDRKIYSLTQFCIPFGFGWKMRLNPKFEVAYEVGARLLFTDYLDDVSKTYVDPEVLLLNRGPKSAEMSYRRTTPSSAIEGVIRGNSNSNDQYYFTGIKLIMNLGAQNE